MRPTSVLLIFIAFAASLVAQQPAPAPANPAPAAAPSAADQDAPQKRLDAAKKFLEVSDARKRFEQNLNKLLDDGRSDLLKRNPGLDPRFADEWEKRMRVRVKVDDFFDATAAVYAKYFTRAELDDLTQAQFALKNGHVHPVPAELDKKLKAESPHLQRDINLQTTMVGARLGKEVGVEVEKDHPEWAKPTTPATPEPARK
jgi:hypothetical protein